MEIVVAVCENDAIGRNNSLPWHLRGDLQHFKALTLNKAVLMGRQTFASIGRALPQRLNLVLSRDTGFNAPGCTTVSDLTRVFEVVAAAAEPIMVIGGAQVYRLCLPHTRKIHLTLVKTEVAGADAFFTQWRAPEWVETGRSERQADAHNDFDYSLITLERRG